MTNIYPYVLTPAYKDYIWGGRRIPELFNRDLPDAIYAESWEVSDRAEGHSTVANGPLAGRSLRTVIAEYGQKITGELTSGKTMPLLIKLIDAAENLSVQVHPHDNNAHLTGGEAKTEMWYVIDADENAVIYAGLKPGTAKEDLRAAITENTVKQLLKSFRPKKGDVFFIPGGRVHAIGAGCLLLEVQQNSNTTYRVYDWGRVDTEGKSRPLHIEQAMQVINWNDTDDPIQKPKHMKGPKAASVSSLLDTQWFSLDRIELRSELEMPGDGSSFSALFIESGSAVIRTPKGDTECRMGQSCLVPAAIKTWSMIAADSDTRILLASV